MKFKEYIFENGMHIIVKGMSKQELKVEERKNGKLITIKYC